VELWKPRLPGEGERRCTGCNFAHYCGEECQKKAWGEHRVQCREIQEEFTTVYVAKVAHGHHGDTMDHPTMNTITKGAFKVQLIPYGGEEEDLPSDQLVIINNPSRGDGHIECTIPCNNLKKRLNGCYMAVVKENNPCSKTMTLGINLERRLADPLWFANCDKSPFLRAMFFFNSFKYDFELKQFFRSKVV